MRATHNLSAALFILRGRRRRSAHHRGRCLHGPRALRHRARRRPSAQASRELPALRRHGVLLRQVFHRVIKGYIVQAGGVDRKLRTRPTLPPVENESRNGLSNLRSSVAAARGQDADSATSQFFVNIEDNTRLDASKEPGYTVFGRVKESLPVVDRISGLPTSAVEPFPRDVPTPLPVILSIARLDAGVLAYDELLRRTDAEIVKFEMDCGGGRRRSRPGRLLREASGTLPAGAREGLPAAARPSQPTRAGRTRRRGAAAARSTIGRSSRPLSTGGLEHFFAEQEGPFTTNEPARGGRGRLRLPRRVSA